MTALTIETLDTCDRIIAACEARREIESLLAAARIEALIEITLAQLDAEIRMVP